VHECLPCEAAGSERRCSLKCPSGVCPGGGPDVERLEQHYRRLEDLEPNRARYDYNSPAFDFRAVLTYDQFGLVLDYPGIADRVA